MLAGLFLISGLASLALPGLSTFVSEFLVLVGTFTRYKVAAAFATAGIILAAIYILWMYQRTMTGPVREQVARMPDLKARELWAVGPLIALIIAFGVYPKPLLDIINPAVHQTLVQMRATDPAPPHPAPANLAPVAYAWFSNNSSVGALTHGRAAGALSKNGAAGAPSQKGTTP
jgi:NADH-quinone oxidoreductase subunit M